MKRLLYTCIVLGLVGSAMSLTTFNKVFHDKYDIKSSSNLGKANCGACHLSAKGGKLNPYGTDLQKVMKEAKTKKLTPELLAKIESMDSDKDGKTNIAELKADSNPGAK